MTHYSPTLTVHRLLISKGGGFVYNEKFHIGLNVIRGQNSSGKTTIVKALVYGLGGAIPNMAKELKLCDYVIVETKINDDFVTLKRNISESNSEGMEIFWGSYDESISADISSWNLYSYRRSETKESFTQVLFRAMDMPEVKGYQTAIVTMHQILRLMYGDQSTPGNEVFTSDTFDSQDVRQAVGDLLFGIYDDDLYNAKKSKDIDSKNLSLSISELRGLFRVLNKSEGELNFLNYDQEIAETQNKITSLRLSMLSIFSGELDINDKEIASELKQEILKIEKSISKMKSEFLGLSEELDSVSFEISDSEMFISTLIHKANCLDDAINIKGIFEAISFEFCPSCHAPLTDFSRESDQCHLCGSKAEPGGNRNHHRMRNDIYNQITESKSLLVDRISRKSSLEIEIPYIRKKISAMESKYRAITTGIKTNREEIIAQLSNEIGSLERTMQFYTDQSKIFDEIGQLIRSRDELQSSVHNADLKIRAIINGLEARRLKVSGDISKEIVSILNQDLHRQDAFRDANSFTINFEKNKFSVDGDDVFSESSTVFAKNAMLLGFLSASMKNDLMRFPRFLILDGIENGGMERDRSYNFQNIIKKISDNFVLDHQIIITTAQISPDIEGTLATVGEPYTGTNKSLKFSRNII